MKSKNRRQHELFEAAKALPPEEREAYLEAACGEQRELREAVTRLLEVHDAGGPLDRPEIPPEASVQSSSAGPTGDGVEGILEKVGDRLGRYRLRRLLGEGGFGAVFLADQEGAISRRVALKIIKPGMDTRPVIARFEAERQALALMEHPGIAKVFDAGTTETGRPYFVMEYVRGTSITRYCDDKRLDLRQRLELFSRAARAVHHAHQKGVIHRDLKPSNIMVSEAGGEAVPKVIDFGIAKAIRDPLTDETLMTKWGQVVGTPEYMSPEQAEGSGKDLDIRTDVYSLGVVLYELLTGVRPFETERRTWEWLNKIHQLDPVRPSRRLADLGERGSQLASLRSTTSTTLQRRLRSELDWIVLKAIARERSRRYDSVAAFAADVDNYLTNEPVLATPPSTAYRLSKFIARHKAWIGGAALALLALVVGLAFAIVGFVEARRERDAAQLARDQAESVLEFLTGMLASADPAQQGRDVTVLEILNQSSSGLHDTFAGQPLVEARLRHTVGKTYSALGRDSEAEDHLEKAVTLREKTLGPEHPDTLASVASLAATYYAQGRTNEAEPLYQRALDGWRKTLGEEHEFSLGVMNNLAQLYAGSGRLEEADELQSRVLEVQTRILGSDHPNTLGSRINLARIRGARGKPEDELEMIREAWESWRQAHGEKHPGALLALHNLAHAYLRTGEVAKAEELTRQAWAARREVLGDTHPNTWTSQHNLAVILSRQRRTNEAEALLRPIVVAPQEAGYPPVRFAATTLLLDLYRREEWPERSRPVLPRASQALRFLAEWENASPLDLNNAAWFLMTLPSAELRDVKLALRAAEQSCQKERLQAGGQLWRFLDTLALAQHANGDSEKAVATQREALRLAPEDQEAARAEMEQHLETFLSAVDRDPLH